MNLWTQNREMSQPWSMHTFQEHINNQTGSAAAFDSMWAQMQKIIGTLLRLLQYCQGMTGTLRNWNSQVRKPTDVTTNPNVQHLAIDYGGYHAMHVHGVSPCSVP